MLICTILLPVSTVLYARNFEQKSTERHSYKYDKFVPTDEDEGENEAHDPRLLKVGYDGTDEEEKDEDESEFVDFNAQSKKRFPPTRIDTGETQKKQPPERHEIDFANLDKWTQEPDKPLKEFTTSQKKEARESDSGDFDFESVSSKD